MTAAFNLPPRYNAEQRLVFLDQALGASRASRCHKAAFTVRYPVGQIGIRSSPSKASLCGTQSTADVGLDSSQRRALITLGLKLLKGRWFDDRDLQNSPAVVVVNETLARRVRHQR